MYYVYILKSLKDKKLYIGFSGDVAKRLKEHNNGKVFATKYRRPLEILYYESYKSREAAREREKKLKQFGSAYHGLIKRLKLK